MHYCKNCDKLLDEGVKDCHYCGKSAQRKGVSTNTTAPAENTPVFSSSPRPPSRPNRSRNGVIAFVVLFLALAAILPAIVFSVLSTSQQRQGWEFVWDAPEWNFEEHTWPWGEDWAQETSVWRLLALPEDYLGQDVIITVTIDAIRQVDANEDTIYGMQFHDAPVTVLYAQDWSGDPLLIAISEPNTWRIGQMTQFHGIFLGPVEVYGTPWPIIEAYSWN